MNDPASDALVKARLSGVEFRRWRMLMNKIDEFEKQRQTLQTEMGKLNRESAKLYVEMRKLWEFTK